MTQPRPDSSKDHGAPVLVASDALTDMIDGGAPLGAIAALLDGLSHEQRWAQVQRTSKAHQRALFERAAGGEPLTADDFVPPHVPDHTPVVHHGFNSLPLFRRFAKPMARAPGGAALFGYNEGATRWLVGPGYFVLQGTEGTAHWVERGAQVVDYYQVPEGAVPAGWPRVRPNWLGLQLFVYHQTRDFMRRVSRHVTIGSAYKWDRKLDSYFVLVREDAQGG